MVNGAVEAGGGVRRGLRQTIEAGAALKIVAEAACPQ
jgi:hypothetical protein